MEKVTFNSVREKLFNDIKRHSLLPIIGSGFSCGCETKHGGKVPSGTEYKDYMLKEITNSGILNSDDINELKDKSFSAISEVFNTDKIISTDCRHNYLKKNFCDVIINDKNRKNFINLDWDYIYTLNIDDAIEKNSRFDQVIYANRDVNENAFMNSPSVIKLHGDARDIVSYKDSKCEIFDLRQYAISPDTNANLLTKLKHDFEYQNIIYIGCSLDDEIDLAYSSHFKSVTTTNRYFCHVGPLGPLKEIKLNKYGITQCIQFESYDSIYSNIINLFEEAQKVQTDDLEDYIYTQYSVIESGFEKNSEYLFQGKSPLVKSNTIELPNYFIHRAIADTIVKNLPIHPLQVLYGQGCTGKSYICIELSSLIRNKNVYFFESRNSLSFSALTTLLEKKESLFIFDEHVLSNSQVEFVIKSLYRIKDNNSSILIVAKKSNRDLPGLITLCINRDSALEKNIVQLEIKNKFSADETERLNSLLVNSSLGVFYEDKSVVDNIILASSELSIENRYSKILPQSESIRQIVSLIILSIKRKLYSKDCVYYDIEKEMIEHCKNTAPMIEQDYTKQFELSSKNNSPIKYVLNAEYWLCDFLSKYLITNKDTVIEAFKYIIRQIILHSEKPNISYSSKDPPYKDFILFDNINHIFMKANLFLIKDIYESLNDELSSDPNFLHQRAKCYIRLSEFCKKKEEKLEFLNKAFRDSNTAYLVFNKRFEDCENEKVYISASHSLYTKALCQCHLCKLNKFSDKSQNTTACILLNKALQSPYNVYSKPNKDRYNYGDVIMKLIKRIVSKPDTIEDTARESLSDIINFIMRNDSDESYVRK